jgi:rRNA maturation protein Nop10
MKRRNPIRINALAFSIMVKALLDGGYTMNELVETTGLAIATISRYVNAMHKAGAVYISGWEQDDCGRYTARQFTLGDGMDMKKPKPAPRKVRDARWRAKLKNIKLIQRTAA